MRVAVFNLKGGTGKSTTTLNLGTAFSRFGYHILLIDLDGQRTLSYNAGVDRASTTVIHWLNGSSSTDVFVTPNFSLGTGQFKIPLGDLRILPGDIETFRWQLKHDSFRKAIQKLDDYKYEGKHKYKAVLMDCPPSLSAISTQALLHADRILLPTLCEPASLKGLVEAVTLIRQERDVPIDVVRVRYRGKLQSTQRADEALMEGAQELGFHLLLTTIPNNVAVLESVAAQLPVVKYSPFSPGAKAYEDLAKECQLRWWQ